jgi:hypothetical protein
MMMRGSPWSIAAVSQYVTEKTPLSDVFKAVEFVRKVGMSCVAINGL